MSDNRPPPRPRPPREPRRGPLEVYGGAPPARSALTLRLVLASFGLALSAIGAIWGALAGVPLPLVVLFCAVAAVSAIDLAVIIRRKRRGEPG